MGHVGLHPSRLSGTRREMRFAPVLVGADPGAAARGILLALALSCVAWIGLALVVPLLW